MLGEGTGQESGPLYASWDGMTNLGLIDFKFGLYIKVNVNDWQNKFKVHISKNSTIMAINWHKIGQMPILGKNI